VSPIEAARQRHSLATVARRSGISLAGDIGSLTVRCPLPSHGHPDRTPSMRLYLDDGIFHCFGCGASGDVVQWVRCATGVGVRDAIALLDSRTPLANAWAGHGNPTTAPKRLGWAGAVAPTEAAGRPEGPDLTRTPPERVYAALQAAWEYYTYRPLHERGLAYLAGRGIDATVLEAHTGRAEVGHSPAAPYGLVAALCSKGFSDAELVDAGLAHHPASGAPVSDFYRQRVLIPVRDDQDHIAGFIGRNVGDQGRWAKYKNPPLTHAYDKSTNLYQPLPATGGRTGQVVVVEGTLDAMAIAVAAIRTGQADRFCPLTQSGRELSSRQLDYSLGLRCPVVLGFDGDSAGREAAYRHVLKASGLGHDMAVTVLPDDHDPASWLFEHGDHGLAAWSTAELSTSTGPFSPMPVHGAEFVASYRVTDREATDAHHPVTGRCVGTPAARVRQPVGPPELCDSGTISTGDGSIEL
jgi:DNA primase